MPVEERLLILVDLCRFVNENTNLLCIPTNWIVAEVNHLSVSQKCDDRLDFLIENTAKVA